MKKTIFAILLSLPTLGAADPAPFGLEIGKATFKDVKAKYSVQVTGINKYTRGLMYKLSGIDFEGLQKATAIFNQDDTLLAILTTLPKNKFNYLLNSLNNKYQLVSKNIPFVGNKSAKFIDGNTEITLDAPHMSFQMEMNYINKDLLKLYKTESNNEQQQKKKREQSQL